MPAPNALAGVAAVLWSTLLAAALADTDSTTTTASSATSAAEQGDGAETIGAEYVVNPNIHPLERIEQWTEQIEKNNGTNAIDFMNRGVAFQEQGTHEETDPKLIDQRRMEAEADYKKSIKLDPTNPSVHYNLGNLKRRQSRWAEAASAYLEANTNAPDGFHVMATTGLANAYSKLNRHAEAIEAYDVVLSKDPTDSRAKLLRGEAHAGLTNTESAELDFSAGIDALKEKAKASTNGISDDDKKLLAAAHFKRGQLYLKDPSEDSQEKACKDFTRALKGITKAGDIANTRKLRSECRRATENYQGAVDDLSKSIELVEGMNFKVFPEPGWFAFRAMCQEKLGNVDAALVDYAKAVEIKPAEGAAWVNMGHIYQERRDWPEAINAYGHRIEIGGAKQHVAKAHVNRGFCLEQAGDRELALADYIEACELDSELGCQNKKILQDDGVVASDPSRVAAKGPSSTTSTSGSVRSGRAMGATTQVTAAAGTVHVPASMKSGKDDL